MAISNKRIVRFKDGLVTFRYQDNNDTWHCKTLPAEAFMSRFLQHVLPRRFVKVRYYGFLNPRKRALLEAAQALFGATPAKGNCSGEPPDTDKPPVMRCPKCGTPLVFVREIPPLRQSESFANACRAP